MKQITNKEYEEWQKYKAEKAKGHVLLPDTVRFICEANGYDAEKIGQLACLDLHIEHLLPNKFWMSFLTALFFGGLFFMSSFVLLCLFLPVLVYYCPLLSVSPLCLFCLDIFHLSLFSLYYVCFCLFYSLFFILFLYSFSLFFFFIFFSLFFFFIFFFFFRRFFIDSRVCF